MGLLKQGLLALLGLFIFSACTKTPTAMSLHDQGLLQKTLKNSLYAANPKQWVSDTNVKLQDKVPSNLQTALSLYKRQHKDQGSHNYDFLQKMGINILKEALSQEDIEAQILAIYGVDLAKHTQLMPILEKAMQVPDNVVQITALQTLAKFPENKAMDLMVQACSSEFLNVAVTAAFYLAQNKHPLAFELIESLMDKVPAECLEIFPSILSLIDTPRATQRIKKCILNSEESVRVAAVLAASGSQRTELLPEIRALSKQHSVRLQEACAHALGELHDEASITTLKKLAKSSSNSVALSALNALRKLGDPDAIAQIEEFAISKNPFSIQLLKDCPGDIYLLQTLAQGASNDPVVLNASLALLKKKDISSLPTILSILIPENENLMISSIPSPGGALSMYKLQYKSFATRSIPQIQQMSLDVRAQILAECSELPEEAFLEIASQIIDANQNDLIPLVTNHLMTLQTSSSVNLLKKWQQKVGAPYVRICSSLALYKLNEKGPWKDHIISWLRKQKKHPLVKLRAISKWNYKQLPSPYEMNPLEISKTMIEAYLELADKQDEEGIEVILENLSNDRLKNKYALAGLLVLATQ